MSRVAGREHAAALMSYPRGSMTAMRWFAGVYPGSVLRFRWHALVTGQTAGEIDPESKAAGEVTALWQWANA